MKNHKLLFLVIILFVLVPCIFFFRFFVHNDLMKRADINFYVDSVRIGNTQDYKKYYQFVETLEKEDSVFDNYNLVVISGRIINKSNFNIRDIYTNEIQNEELRLVSNCTDVFPQYIVEKGTTDVDMYVMINKTVNETDYKTILKTTNIKMNCLVEEKLNKEIPIIWDSTLSQED